MKQHKQSITTNANVKLPEGCNVEEMRQQFDKVHQDFNSQIAKLAQAIKSIHESTIADIEAKLQQLTTQFEEALQQAELELAQCVPEGDEKQLRDTIEKVFKVDKAAHEKLQKIVSEVESEQLNLNQAKLNMGQEKKVYDKPLIEKMTQMHIKCDEQVQAVQNKLQQLLQSQCDALEAEMNKIIQEFQKEAQVAIEKIHAIQYQGLPEGELRALVNQIIENDS